MQKHFRIRSQLFAGKLQFMQLRIEPALAEKLSVVTTLDNFAAVDDEDDIGGLDRLEPVRDYDGGLPYSQPLQRIQYKFFGG